MFFPLVFSIPKQMSRPHLYNNITTPIKCQMKFGTFGARLVHFLIRYPFFCQFGNSSRIIKDRVSERQRPLKNKSHCGCFVVTSGITLSHSFLNLFWHFQLVSIWMLAARKIRCRGEKNLDRIAEKRFSWIQLIGHLWNGPMSLLITYSRVRKHSRYLPLDRPGEGRSKLVTTTSGLCDGINDPFYMDRWIQRPATKASTPSFRLCEAFVSLKYGCHKSSMENEAAPFPMVLTPP